uniref:DUF262 domain-containing protein n=1 Tax=Ruminococcus bromii TaxID=40518 RepID=UPI003FF053CD
MAMVSIERLESEIENQQRNVSYDTKEYTIEIVVQKYLNDLDKNENEFFVPEYQREFVWDEVRQSRFIESLMIGLPIPYIFLAETDKGRYEIVDGSQRIRTLAAFLNDELKIKGLEKIEDLNNLVFSNLDISRQRKFKNISLKMIVLSERTTDETKNDIFERINRGSDLLKDMEYRKGIYTGEFNEFLYKLSKDELYVKLTPIAKWLEKRQEREELLLRFFAFSEWYPSFSDSKGISKQLDDYMKEKNVIFNKDIEKEMTKKFNITMKFVDKYYPYGFAKNERARQVARPYFEALSVGAYLALKDNPSLTISKENIISILTNGEFLTSVSGRYQTHKAKTIRERIDYVKDRLKEYAD